LKYSNEENMSEKSIRDRLPNRGANGDISKFAPDFLKKRLDGFEKDMRICLSGVPRTDKPGEMTHAYFPALMACCGLLEYAACFYTGRKTFKGTTQDYQEYAREYLRDYSSDAIRVLHRLFRNAVAHRSIASGVWVDDKEQRRIVWTIDETSDSPAIEIKEAPGCLKLDSPWPCKYTHRVHIHLGALWKDIKDSIERYANALEANGGNGNLVKNFRNCLKTLYPV
jgi:hypothetical protein